MDYPWGKFGDRRFSRFGFIMRTYRQTESHFISQTDSVLRGAPLYFQALDGTNSLYLHMEGWIIWVDLSSWLDYQLKIPVLTGLGTEQLQWMRQILLKSLA